MNRNPLLTLLSPALVLGLTAAASAVNPSVTAVRPAGFQRGTEVEVQLAGARIGDAQELLFYSPGIQVQELVAEKDNLLKAKLVVAADCRMGIHALRLRTATGISNLRTFTVGALPEVAEKEPNNDFAQPQAVPIDCTVSGIVQNEDVDYFIVEAKQGERIVAELEGIRLGYTFFDPFLAILNTERFELARSDDAALLRQDCLCAVVAPKDGKYIVQVRESAYGGNGSCYYRLHIGRFPRPTAVFPAGGRPGEVLSVQWIGDPTGPLSEQITLPTDSGTTYELFAKDQFGVAPSPNVVRIIDVENTLEAEPNNSRDEATVAAAPGALNGVIQEPGDVDTFRFSAKKDQQYDIRVYARKPFRSPLDSVMAVRRANGSAVGSNDDSGGPDSYYRFKAPADEDYFVEIYDQLRGGGPDFVYRIEVTPIERTLTMVLPEQVRYFSTTLSVPRANCMALMVNATRANWGGDLNLAFEQLPEGITVQTVTMPANRSTIPVLFSAGAEAPLAGSLAQVIGRSVDEKLNVVGHLASRTMLVRGQNNRDVWGHDAERMAAAVTEASPFEIEIVQSKVPIARQGSKSLKIVAKRQEGFDAAIAVRMLYNPPGIGSSGSISIAKGKNEAEIPLTANTSAAIGKWPIVVTGTATVGNGPVAVASQMAELEISDSYFGFAFEKSAAELGQETQVVVKLETKIDYEGEALIQLLGLPANTATAPEPQKITKATESVAFLVKVDEKAKPGVYKSLVCRAPITRDGEPIMHTIGTGELRIDKPLPPQVAAPKPKPQAKAKPKPQATKQAPKPLSRLEQLRLQKEQTVEGDGS